MKMKVLPICLVFLSVVSPIRTQPLNPSDPEKDINGTGIHETSITDPSPARYLKGTMRVRISESRRMMEGIKTIKVSENEIEYHADLIFRVNFENLQFLQENSEKTRSDWNSFPVLEGDSFYREWDPATTEPVVSIMNPIKAQSNFRTLGFRGSNFENWGVLTSGKTSNDIDFQHISATIIPYVPWSGNASPAPRPDRYALKITATIIPENINTRDYASTSSGSLQEWDPSFEKMIDIPPPYSLNIPYAKDPFSEWGNSYEAIPPLIATVALDSFLVNSGKGWELTLEGNCSGDNDEEETSIKMHITLSLNPTTLKKEDEDSELKLDGCFSLIPGDYGEITAVGKPEGGSYAFRIEPGNIMLVLPAGSSAVIQGTTPGRGTIIAEYHTPEGNTLQASHPVSCVQINTYNAGKPVPRKVLYNEEGQSLGRTIRIPMDASPEKVGELVDFKASQVGIVTASCRDNSLELEVLRAGTTTLQAFTDCDRPVGPEVDIEIVNCTEETIAILDEQMRIAREFQKQQLKEISDILSSDKFEHASNNIEESTKNLAIKLTSLIAGSIAGTPGAKTAANVIGVWSTVRDIFLRGGDVWQQAYNLNSLIIGLGQETIDATSRSAAYLGYLSGVMAIKETAEAVDEFSNDLYELLAADSRLGPAMEHLDNANRLIFKIAQCQRLCRTGNQTEIIADYVQPDYMALSPVGFPYSENDCGCNNYQDVGLTSAGLSDLRTGLENLGKCVEDLVNGPLNGYANSLEEWKKTCERISQAAKMGPGEFNRVAGESIPLIENYIESARQFEEAGKVFLENFKSCPESAGSAASILKSAVNINDGKEE